MNRHGNIRIIHLKTMVGRPFRGDERVSLPVKRLVFLRKKTQKRPRYISRYNIIVQHTMRREKTLGKTIYSHFSYNIQGYKICVGPSIVLFRRFFFFFFFRLFPSGVATADFLSPVLPLVFSLQTFPPVLSL